MTATATDTGELEAPQRSGLPFEPRRLGLYVGTAAVLLIGWVAGDHLLPRGVPPGVLFRGLIFGSLDALVAMGIVLIYKANKVVNFAQAELGSVAAVVAIELKLKWHWNYFIAIGAGLVLALAIGIAVEVLIIRRFAKAPRLILAVATIGLAQVLQGFSLLIPLKWGGLQSGTFETPFNIHFKIYPQVFFGDHLMVLIVVGGALIGLAWFLRFTDYGVAIRAAAENGDRANLLGVPVMRLSTVVWGIAAVLSAVAVVLRAPAVGFSSFSSVSGGGFSLLLRALAAAVIGGMSSLPTTFVAAVGLGIAGELTSWTFHNGDYMNLVLLIIILGVFLVQRQKFSRASETGISTWKAMREVRPVPKELRRLREVRLTFGGAKLLLFGLVLVFPIFASPSQEQLMALIFIYAIIAVSLVVLTGWGGNISLGQFALVGFGAATTGTLVAGHNWDLFLAIPVAMLVSAAVAFLIGLPALRITGPFLAVTTLAFAVVSGSVFLQHRYFGWFVPDFVPRPVLWQRVRWDADWQMYFVAFAGLVLAMAAARSLRNSRTGRVILATRDNFQAAQAVSVPTMRVKLTAFAVSGAIAGLAGALYVLHQTAFKSDAFGPEVSLRLFTMVVIGGLGSLPGAVLGAVYVRGVEFFLRGGYAQIASGGGLVALLLVLPGGLGELMYRIRDHFLRWVAKRHRLVVPSLVADIRLETEEAPIALGAALGGLANRTFGPGRRPSTNGTGNGKANGDGNGRSEDRELTEAATS